MWKRPFAKIYYIYVWSFVLVGCSASTDPDDLAAYAIQTPWPQVRTQAQNGNWTPLEGWSAEEGAQLQNLWLGSLPSPPVDRSNAVSNDPRAAALGHSLFFDRRLSANGQVSCAGCHIPDFSFADRLPRGLGTRTTRRNTMTLIGAAYNDWFLWDGHKDSLWSQALEPLTHPDEHGTTRLHIVHLINQDAEYRQQYEALFGPFPPAITDFSRFPDSGGPEATGPYRQAWRGMTAADQAAATKIYVNVGKALAAYERLLLPGPSRFDQYVQALLSGDEQAATRTLSPAERSGLRVFLGEGDCVRCHNGPLFTDHQFHNTGLPLEAGHLPDEGRKLGYQLTQADPFNCRGGYSDATPADCAALVTPADPDEGLYRFKTPTLRNVSETGPYMHTGQFDTIAAVLDHYNVAPKAPLGQSEIKPLGLSDQAVADLAAFLQTLGAPLMTPPELLVAPE